jgi:uncharacterized protein
MRFDEGSNLDTSQVTDVRRARVPGGGIAVGGGVGVIGLILALIFGFNPFDTGQGSGAFPGLDQVQGDNRQLEAECRTGADANTKEDCRIVASVNSIQQFWTAEFDRRGGRYETAQTTLFAQATQTGCGAASSQVGPFYCPRDQSIYIDLGFFDQLSSRFGARGGPFAESYVLAHEYGHHVQNLLGTMQRVGNQQGPESGSVRLELQADCYAGVWANTVFEQGQLEEGDVEEAIAASGAVGDDRLQRRATGSVNPDSFTHGSSEQRARWFNTGLERGEPGDCDTFAAESL